jgi:hypothetical protein
LSAHPPSFLGHQIEAYKTINEKYMSQKATVIRQHGVIPILEIIEAASDSTALRILQLLNLVPPPHTLSSHTHTHTPHTRVLSSS